MHVQRLNYINFCVYFHAGLRFIPLRTPGGEYASHIGIFAKIKIRKLNQKQASSSGMCLQEDSNTLKWANPFKTCPSDREAIAIKECKLSKHKEEGAIGVQFSHDAAVGKNANSEQRQSRLAREEAVVQCTAEIHANPFTDHDYLVTEV